MKIIKLFILLCISKIFLSLSKKKNLEESNSLTDNQEERLRSGKSSRLINPVVNPGSPTGKSTVNAQLQPSYQGQQVQQTQQGQQITPDATTQLNPQNNYRRGAQFKNNLGRPQNMQLNNQNGQPGGVNNLENIRNNRQGPISNSNFTMSYNTDVMPNMQPNNGITGGKTNKPYPGMNTNTPNKNQNPGINLMQQDHGDDEYEEIIEEITTTTQLPQKSNNNVQNPGVSNHIQLQPVPQGQQPQQIVQPTGPLNNQGIAQNNAVQEQGQMNQPITQQPVQGVGYDIQQQAYPNNLPNINSQNLGAQVQGYPVNAKDNNLEIQMYYPNFSKSNNLRNNNLNNSNSNSYNAVVYINPIGPQNNNNKIGQSNCCDETKIKKCNDKCQFRGGMDQCLVNVDISYTSTCGEEKFKHLDEACICKESKHRYNISNKYVFKKK